MTPLSRSSRGHTLALLSYLTLSLLYLGVTWERFSTHIPADRIDPVFILYILKWGMHQIHLALNGVWPDFWNAPFFYPTQQVVTFSDHVAGPAVLAAAFTALYPNAIAAYNLLFVGSFVLCGWGTYAVLRWSGLGGAAAFVGGIVYAFSSFRWDQMSHLQVLLAQWIPLVLWSWHRLLAQPGVRRALVFLSFYLLHVTGGCYLAYMIHVPLLALLLAHRSELRQPGKLSTLLKVLVPTVLAASLVVVPLYLPYARNAEGRGFERSGEEVRRYGASLVSFLTPTASNLYAGSWTEPWRRWENALFPGFLASGLLIGGAVTGWRRRRTPPFQPLSRGRKALLAGLAGLAVIGWILGELRTWSVFAPDAVSKPPGSGDVHAILLAAGLAAVLLRRWWGGNWPLRLADLDPWTRGLLAASVLCFLLSFPTIYLPLRQVIPGLGAMRVPARFYPFLSFIIAFFAAGTLDRLRARASVRKRRWAIALAGAFLLLEVTPKSINWAPLPREAEFPPVYAWLAQQEDVRALLELPLRDPTAEVRYMYLGTRHWKPLVNGYSGDFPRQYQRIRQSCWPALSPAAIEQLRTWGVTHLLVHWRRRWPSWKRAAYRDLQARGEIALERTFDQDRIYRILPAREGRSRD